MNKEMPTTITMSDHEARRKGISVAIVIMILFVFSALTVRPPLSRGTVITYGLLSLALAALYLLGTPRITRISEQKGMVSMLPVTALGAFLLLAISLTVWGRVQIYFLIFVLIGYTLPIYFFEKRIWSIIFLLAMLLLSWLCYGILGGWETAGAELLDDVPWLALIISLAEGTIHRIEQRDRSAALATELKEAHRQLQAYARQTEELTITRERARLAHEIHDTVGHTLTALDVQLELLTRLPADHTEMRIQATEKAHSLVKAGLTDVRRAVQALQPLALENFLLSEAIADLVAAFEERSSISLDYRVEGSSVSLPSNVALLLYRAAQESLTNIQRHAPNAEQATLRLIYSPDDVIFLAENDGVLPEMVGKSCDGRGLSGLRQRIETMGGEFQTEMDKEGRFLMQICLHHAGSRPSHGIMTVKS